MTSKATSRGVLLTLGITFISLIVLSFATLILRNAENSDLRLTELSSVDRLYTLSSSMERSIFRSYYSLTGINLTLTKDAITIVKDTKRSGVPNYYQPPDTTDQSILGIKAGDIYVDLLARSLTYGTVSVANAIGYTLSHYLTLTFYYPTLVFNNFLVPDVFKTVLLYAYSDDNVNLTKDYNFRHSLQTSQYCCFEIGNMSNLYPINSTSQLYLLGSYINNLTEIKIKVQHPTRCPYINWSNSGTRRLNEAQHGYVPANGDVKLKISIQAESEQGSCLPATLSPYYEVQNDAILNRTGVTISHIIFLDNLTNDPSVSGYNFIYGETPPASASKERPFIMIYDSKAQTGTEVSVASNILYLFQYDNPIRWEVTLKYNFGPVEVYTTETVTATLDALNVSRRQRLVRFK